MGDKVVCKVILCDLVNVGITMSMFCFLFLNSYALVQVDYKRRTLIAPNHTCTHMLNFALRV